MMRGGFDSPDDSSSRGDTAHAPLIQVETPNLGNIHRLRTIQATTNPIMIKASDIEVFRSTLFDLALWWRTDNALLLII